MRIMLADNRRKVRFALRALLEQQAGLEVIDEAVDAQYLLAQVEEDCPDVVLLDWELPGMAPADLISALRQECPDLLVVALSGRVNARRAASAAGADAFVSKGEPPERLLSVIQCCAEKCSGC
ncbi:MAG: hypothetical protein CEE40_08310 [Chloroflexi bacterium B3_Chlor]|nr:MAG: hypothetical protein CEE40_08310 [Chloroflexi bacterium B3_Chlor]